MWKVWGTGGESSVYSREKCGRCRALVGRVVFIQEREEWVWNLWSTGGERSVYSRKKCGRCGALVERVVFIQERSVEGVEHWWGKWCLFKREVVVVNQC